MDQGFKLTVSFVEAAMLSWRTDTCTINADAMISRVRRLIASRDEAHKSGGRRARGAAGPVAGRRRL